ncbi:MAG: GNAT family N-acetyltransferase [Hyphomonadaceae bacterium]
MKVRDLAAADRAQWEPLWRGYLDFYEEAFEGPQADLTFSRLLDPDEPMFAFAAEDDDGALIGIVHCVLHRSTGTRGDYCYLQDLFTAPAARNKGAGRALIEAVYARADALGCARVYWHTHRDNTVAQALYDKLAERSAFVQYRRKAP